MKKRIFLLSIAEIYVYHIYLFRKDLNILSISEIYSKELKVTFLTKFDRNHKILIYNKIVVFSESLDK